MRLKSLSLFGFKSFAHRTELLFAPGITAIVGPNGAGKSNILDAIVWVLGERSAKTLRSLKAADLLFAGNGHLKPASLAEVTLALELPEEGSEDNHTYSSALPTELLSEIVITRRLKRTGESQFFINRVPCRLKDVQDLLLELGLSSDSYAFVGQAEIDRLVLLSPQERRELIEQAAGIHRFQLRREDALEKLDRTTRNLTRLHDLIAELERQREALSGEVAKARHYEQLLRRQRELQIALLGWEHLVRVRRVERLQEELTNLRQAVAESDQQIAATNAERTEVESALARMEAGLQELQAAAAQALEEAKELENELALCAERQRYLTQRRAQIEQQRAQLKERAQRTAEELIRTQREQETLQQQHSLFEQQRVQLQETLQVAQQQVAQWEAEVKEAQDAHFEAERTLAETRSQHLSLEPLLQSLLSRQREIEQERATAQEQWNQLQRQWEEVAAQQRAVDDEALAAAIQALQHRVERARHAVSLLHQQLTQAREQLAALRARLAALEEMDFSLTGIPQGARAVLIAQRDGRLQGEFHLLAHLVRVPAGLEIAYESALGAAANYLVTPTFAEAQTAIEFLKRHNAGRATFIALDFLSELAHEDAHRSTSPQSPVPDPTGVIGWAADLVQVTDERFAKAVQHVLRNTLLVEDLSVARRLAPQLRGVRFVTKSGEVVAPSGTISGGATVQGAGSLLVRQREREELAQRIRNLETQTRQLEQQLQAAEAELAQAQSELMAKQQEWNEQRRAREQVAERVRLLTAEKERQQRELVRLEAEASRLQREIANLQQERERLQQLMARKEVERTEAQRRLEEARTRLTQALQHLDEVRQQWQQRQMAANQWQTQLTALQQRAKELSEALEELERQDQALADEAMSIDNEMHALAARIPELRERLNGCQQRRERMEAALSNWHEERKKLLARREELEQRLAALNEQRAAQLEEVHRCEVRLTQAEMERAEIERRLTEEFQVSVETAHHAAQQLEQKQAALDELERIKQEMASLGEVRLSVLDEYERLNERIRFLQEQVDDLTKAREELLSGLEALERQFRERFREVLSVVSESFNEIIQRFWRGGEGRLVLAEGQTLAESGVEVKVRLPGKAEQDLLALSGGEKAIVGLCLLFALLKVNPAPFVFLDEVDAPLDDTNTDRFVSLLREFSERTQFIVITHNPITMQAADHLYGITLDSDGSSKVLSLSLKEALEWAEQV